MKKKIYVLPQSPSKNEVQDLINNLQPPLSDTLKNRIIDSFLNIQDRLFNIPVNQSNFHFNQSQTFSDSNHTITLKGQLKAPTFFDKLFGKF